MRRIQTRGRSRLANNNRVASRNQHDASRHSASGLHQTPFPINTRKTGFPRKTGLLTVAGLLTVMGLMFSCGGCGSSAKPPRPAPAEPKVKVTPTRPKAVVKEQTQPVPKEKVAPSDLATLQVRNLLRDVSADDVEKRAIAGERIESIEGSNSLVLNLLTDEQAEIRRGAAYYLLDRFDPSSEEMFVAFEGALKDEDRLVRRLALQVVQRFPRERLVGAVSKLGALLENPDEDPVNRAALARRIASLELDGGEALPHLRRTARSEAEPTVKKACAFAISRVAPPEKSVPLLLEIVARESNPEVKFVAIARLGRLGGDAEAAVEPLCGELKGPTEKVRRGAADALARIGVPSVAPLIQLLRKGNQQERQLSVYAIGKIGGPAKLAIPVLVELVEKDDDPEVRKLAAVVLKVLQSEP